MTEVCPVCKGRGEMPRGFYLGVDNMWGGGTASDICRICNGSWTILEHPNANVWIDDGLIDYKNNIKYALTPSTKHIEK